MRKSFVLKDLSSHPAGYLIQAGEEIRCRIDGDGERVVVTVLFENGESIDKESDTDGEERRWNGGVWAVNGVYVSAEGALLLSSGSDARRAFEKRSLHGDGASSRMRKQEDDAEAAAAKDNKADSESMKQTSEMESFGFSEAVLPQRRWPPPPCWPQARYVHGRWQGE